jgi:hypothetical protein
LIKKEIIFEVTCTYTILTIYVSVVRWDQKNLKHMHERCNLDRRNLATMLYMKKNTNEVHENETMKVKRVFKSYGKTYKWFSACPSWNSKT